MVSHKSAHASRFLKRPYPRGIQDILHVLKNPSINSPLPPLFDSHQNALVQLTELQTLVAAPPHGLPIPADATPPATHTPTAPSATPPIMADPPLRVAGTCAQSGGTSNCRNHHPQQPQSPHLSKASPLVPCLAPPSGGASFENSTGASGLRRRCNQRKQKGSRPLGTSKTIHPNKSVPAANPRAPPARHPHGTRSQKPPLRHVAAVVLASILAEAHHLNFALHGNAFNPDTGQLAEYRELSQCSEGHLWQASNADEIGCLVKGHGSIKETNTMHFIRVTDIPNGRKATYLRVVLAFRPKKEIPAASAGQLVVATRLTIRSTLVPKPLTSHLPNSSSIACSPSNTPSSSLPT